MESGRYWRISGTIPLRDLCSSRMNRQPNTTISRLALFEVRSGSKSCNQFLASATAAAPTTAPLIVPAPPRTAISRYSMPDLRSNGAGLTKRVICA